MEFWEMAWKFNWCNLEQLRFVVKTATQQFGEISKEEFKQITGKEY